MTRLTIERLAALSLVAGLAAPIASAQTPQSTAPSAPAGQTGPGTAATSTPASGEAAGTASAADRAAEAGLDRRIADLHRRLRITAAQEPAWSSFTAVMRQNLTAMDAKLAARKAGFGSMNAVDDLRSYAAVTATQASNIQNLIGPFQTLYAALTPEQRTTADQIFRDYTTRRTGHTRG